MSKWTPVKGELFYAVCTRVSYKESVDPGSGLPVLLKVQTDRSWQGAIFRMVASDDRMVVAEYAYGDLGQSLANQTITLVRNDFDLQPVGPAVVAALGLKL